MANLALIAKVAWLYGHLRIFLLNSRSATELACSVQPQTSGNAFTTRTLTATVNTGETLLIEVSATTSGAPAGATLQPGNVTLTAQIVKP